MSIEVNPAVVSSQLPSATLVGRWADGTIINISQNIATFRATATVLAGQVVRIATAAAGVVPGVEAVPAVVTNRAIGIALNSATTGQMVRVARDIGWARVGVATSLATARAVSVDGTTAGTVADSGAESAVAATDVGVARSAVVTDFYGTGVSAILVELSLT